MGTAISRSPPVMQEKSRASLLASLPITFSMGMVV
jgi:hypothetical protein